MEKEMVWEVCYNDGNKEVYYDYAKMKLNVLKNYIVGMQESQYEYTDTNLLYDITKWLAKDYIDDYCVVNEVEWERICESYFINPNPFL